VNGVGLVRQLSASRTMNEQPKNGPDNSLCVIDGVSDTKKSQTYRSHIDKDA